MAMIAYLKGKVLFKQAPMVIMDVNDVGYELWVPMPTYYNLSQITQTNPEAKIALYCYQHIREDMNALFGFDDLDQRKLFISLLKTNGVGPRLAMTILSNYSTAEFIKIIGNCDHGSLVRLPGVGQKTAERLLLELKGKLNKIFNQREINEFQKSTKTFPHDNLVNEDMTVSDAIAALEVLGYKLNDVQKIVTKLVKNNPDFSSESLIKAALQEFR